MNWQPGDLFSFTYKGGEPGWGELCHRVTEEDLPIVHEATAGQWLWRPVGSNIIHEQALDEADLDEQDQSRVLVLQPSFQRQKKIVVLDDLQFVALHAMLSVRQTLTEARARAKSALTRIRKEAEEKRGEARKEAARKLGARVPPPKRTRKTNREIEAEVRLESASAAVGRVNTRISHFVGGDDNAGMHALANSPQWAPLYRLSGGYAGTYEEWEERSVKDRHESRQLAAGRHLRPPKPVKPHHMWSARQARKEGAQTAAEAAEMTGLPEWAMERAW